MDIEQVYKSTWRHAISSTASKSVLTPVFEKEEINVFRNLEEFHLLPVQITLFNLMHKEKFHK